MVGPHMLLVPGVTLVGDRPRSRGGGGRPCLYRARSVGLAGLSGILVSRASEPGHPRVGLEASRESSANSAP